MPWEDLVDQATRRASSVGNGHHRAVRPMDGLALLRQDSPTAFEATLYERAIARAISHIRGEVRSPIAIPDLARRVGMSASSFHKHFETVTSTTPLQYPKDLRLLEARRRLKVGGDSSAGSGCGPACNENGMQNCENCPRGTVVNGYRWYRCF